MNVYISYLKYKHDILSYDYSSESLQLFIHNYFMDNDGAVTRPLKPESQTMRHEVDERLCVSGFFRIFRHTLILT
jgi:hypothetical protein